MWAGRGSEASELARANLPRLEDRASAPGPVPRPAAGSLLTLETPFAPFDFELLPHWTWISRFGVKDLADLRSIKSTVEDVAMSR
jgi:hypothetical protein